MFFVKAQISEGVEIKVDLYEDEIFTTCPDCGVEHSVDHDVLAEVLKEADFASTSIFCSKCTSARRNQETDGYNHHFHVYECEPCILTFAVEQAWEDQEEVVCPVCCSDEHLKDITSGEMKIKYAGESNANK